MIVSITFDDISPAYLSARDLKNIIDFLDEVNIACTFFVVPYENKFNHLVNRKFTLYLKDAINNGHEPALHGYRHIKNEFGCFYPIPLPFPYPPLSRQMESLKKGITFMSDIFGVRPLGFRAPYYLYNKVTLKALSSLGFSYDSSATIFKPTHNPRLRVKWLHNCKPFIKEGLVEIPVTGDYTYNLKDNNFFNLFRIAMRDFEYIKSRHGVFVLNNHPQYLSDVGYRFLRTLFKKLSGSVDFLRLCDVAEIYLK